MLPSIKANYTLAVRCVLTQEGLGCDVFGPAELHAALAGGVPPQLISVNGTGKTRALLEQAVGIGARITLDSVREIELVRAVARDLGRRGAGALPHATALPRAAAARRTSRRHPSTRPRRSTSPASRPTS